MKRHLPEGYNIRPIVETVHSIIKRKVDIVYVKDLRFMNERTVFIAFSSPNWGFGTWSFFVK